MTIDKYETITQGKEEIEKLKHDDAIDALRPAFDEPLLLNKGQPIPSEKWEKAFKKQTPINEGITLKELMDYATFHDKHIGIDIFPDGQIGIDIGKTKGCDDGR